MIGCRKYIYRQKIPIIIIITTSQENANLCNNLLPSIIAENDDDEAESLGEAYYVTLVVVYVMAIGL